MEECDIQQVMRNKLAVAVLLVTLEFSSELVVVVDLEGLYLAVHKQTTHL